MKSSNVGAEQAIIGTVITFPMSSHAAKAVMSEMFSDEVCKFIWIAIERLWDKQVAPDAESVMSEFSSIPAAGKMKPGSMIAWMGLANISNLQQNIQEVALCWRNRQVEKLLTAQKETANELGGWTSDLLEGMLKQTISISHIADGRPRILSEVKKRMLDFNNPPEEFERILSVGGDLLGTRQALTQVAGVQKSGKSSIISRFAMATVVDSDPLRTFNVKVEPNTKGHYILVTDTEQSKFDAYKTMRGAASAVGVHSLPPNIEYLNLRGGLSWKERVQYVNTLVTEGESRFGGVYMVVIDSARDFCANFMDQQQSAITTAWMLDIADRFNCMVVAVNHMNLSKSGSEFKKAAGWLGNSVAASVIGSLFLMLDPDVNLNYIDFGDLRHSDYGDKVYYKFNKDLHYHELVANKAVKSLVSGGRLPAF